MMASSGLHSRSRKEREMNERYLFKAKRIDTGEWVEGYLFDDGMINPKHYFIGSIVIEPYKGTADDDWNITGHCFYEVDASTICQCTGLRDKNGKLIWENDIVSDECGNMAEIIWNNAELQYLIDYEFEPMTLGEWCSVVGNIFDNPELLEVGE